MAIGVLGGTGQTGREVVAELGRRGHRAIALSRTAPAGGEHRRVDVTSGEGLAEAMAGLDALVDVLQGGRPVLVDGVRSALATAREAGVAHVVTLSIVGCDRVPLGYYRVKVEQEAVVREGGVPWSIVRATQFHSLLAESFANAARRGVLPLLRVERVNRLARMWARERGVRRAPLPVPAVGGVPRAVRAGGLTSPGAPHGRVTFEEWLREAA